MEKLKKEDIYIISQHSNLSAKARERALEENVYSDQITLRKWLQILILSLGVGFTVSGVIFFFAYNWADLGKFSKLGLLEGMILLLTLFVLSNKASELTNKILLSGASVLVGGLFAVFGQIYQTGADSYQLFLIWTLCITLWVIVANFSPLWLFYILLINLTINLFFMQQHVSLDSLSLLISYCLNSFIVIGSIILSKNKQPNWLTYAVLLIALFFSTQGISYMIIDSSYSNTLDNSLLMALTILGYSLGFYYGLKSRKAFFLLTIPLSLIFIFCVLLLRHIFVSFVGYSIVGIIAIICITLLIKHVLALQKRWKMEAL